MSQFVARCAAINGKILGFATISCINLLARGKRPEPALNWGRCGMPRPLAPSEAALERKEARPTLEWNLVISMRFLAGKFALLLRPLLWGRVPFAPSLPVLRGPVPRTFGDGVSANRLSRGGVEREPSLLHIGLRNAGSHRQAATWHGRVDIRQER